MKYFLSLLILCALVGCTDQRFSNINSGTKILAFGDSLTAGKGVPKEYSYPSVLAELSGANVINAGISGELTMQGLARFKTILGIHKPDLLILLEGGNDILRKMDLAVTKNNLARMIEIAESKGTKVMLIGVPNKILFSDSAPLYPELAEQYELVFLEDTLADLLRTPEMKSDNVHLNEQGYRALAQAIYDKLRDHGAFQ